MKRRKQYVKIHRELCYGDEVIRVVRDNGSMYVLVDSDGYQFEMAKKHCYQDHQCKKKSLEG